MDFIENKTFDEIKIGESASLTRTLTQRDILLFAAVSGDLNPAHMDEEFARNDMFHKVIAHGMWGAALISTVLGTELPGPGTIYIGQTLSFRRPVAIGDTITVTVTAKERNDAKGRIVFDCQGTNQKAETVVSGTAEVIAPREKVRRAKMALPEVHIFDRYARYRELIQRAEGLEPIRLGIVHPTDRDTLATIQEAMAHKLIVPVLVGPEAKIRAAADAEGVSLFGMELIAAPHSRAAAERAVELARDGNVQALMKGTLATEELLEAIKSAPDHPLATGRRMSHLYALDVPTFPRALFLTDAMLSVHPHLDEKRDIVQNAVDLLRAIGFEQPKVAILAATGRVDRQLPSTLEAAALCKMAERGQIEGAVLDGPLPFDAAVSMQAAAARGIVSPVAGKADLLVVPDLEAGQILVKQLQYLADTPAAGLLLGAKVPIVMSGPEDAPRVRVAACAIVVLLLDANRRRATAQPPLPRAMPRQ